MPEEELTSTEPERKSDDSLKKEGQTAKPRTWDWLKSGSTIAAILGAFATLATYINSSNQLQLENKKFLNNVQIQYFDRINQNDGIKSPHSEMRLFKSIIETTDNISIKNWAQSEMITLEKLSHFDTKIQDATLNEINAREFVLTTELGEPRNKAMRSWNDKRTILKNLMNEFVAAGGAKPQIKLESSPWDEETRDEGILAKQIQNDILKAQLESLSLDITKKKKELKIN